MEGIYGIAFCHKDIVLEPNCLQLMGQAFDSSKGDEGAMRCLRSVGFGAQVQHPRTGGIAEATIQGQPVVLTLWGTLYDLRELYSAEEKEATPAMQLLRLYLQFGVDFLHHLRGDFALSIWDGRTETLYLATDRFRVHPIFYYFDQEKLVFASRVRGILACPFVVHRTLNLEAIVSMVSSYMIPTPKTIFQEIKKLPPGCIITYRKGMIDIKPYWDIDFLHPAQESEAELGQRLKQSLADAVSVRLSADTVPDQLGTFLSGGLDSSTLTGILTQHIGQPIKSFSIGFDEQRFNEIEYARIAARTFGTKHHEYFVSSQDAYDAIPTLVGSFDEPFGNSSAVPVYFCAKMARENGVEVLYAGDGGDELFAGNTRYVRQRLFEYYHQIPSWVREPLLKPLVFTVAEALQLGIFIKGKKYIQRASLSPVERLSMYELFEIISIEDLFEDDFLVSLKDDFYPYKEIHEHYYRAPARTELDRQLYIDLKLAISDNDLIKVTRMAEAAGVTVRFPFLDHQLAEFAAAIPAHVKMRGRKLRTFFKKAYADFLPAETRMKKKHGFGLPISAWLRVDKRFNEMMHELVLSTQTIQRGYFRRKTLEQIVERHRTDESSFYGTILWNLMVLELWHRKNWK